MTKNMKDYAQALSPCCDVLLHRPYTGKDSGRFFCSDCGSTYEVVTFEGESTLTGDHGETYTVKDGVHTTKIVER